MSVSDFSYEKWISESCAFSPEPGLERIRMVLDYAGNPHRNLKYVHIAGTNGKGSIASFISNILIKAGYKTGLYTSPGIESINDRIRINNQKIKDDEARTIANKVKAAMDRLVRNGHQGLTQFEIITCIAFLYFSLNNCDIVVLETGLGGRLDATNVIEAPEVAVITTINYDHTNILGNTLTEIAGEKADIIKKGCIAVCYDNTEEINSVFRERCGKIGAEYRKMDFSKINIRKNDLDGQIFDYNSMKNIFTSLIGQHQSRNASVAIEACFALIDKGYKINMDNIIDGIGCTKWEGRMEVLAKNPAFIVDGAHNTEGVDTLVKNLKIYFGDKKIIFVVGMMEDKDPYNAVRLTAPMAKKYIAVAPDNKRAIPPVRLAAIINEYCNKVEYSDTISSGLDQAFKDAGPEDVICVFGSLYMINDVKKYRGR